MKKDQEKKSECLRRQRVGSVFSSRKAEGCLRQVKDPQGHRGLAADRMTPGKGTRGDLGEGARAKHCPEESWESRHEELWEEMGAGLGWTWR